MASPGSFQGAALMLELPKRHATRTSLELEWQPVPSRTASPWPGRCHWGYQEENQKSEGS